MEVQKGQSMKTKTDYKLDNKVFFYKSKGGFFNDFPLCRECMVSVRCITISYKPRWLSTPYTDGYYRIYVKSPCQDFTRKAMVIFKRVKDK